MAQFEYGISLLRRATTPHRTGMSLKEAVKWMDEWLEDGGREDTFSIIKREVGPWEQVGYLTVIQDEDLSPRSLPTGLAGVREAIKRARGGDAPPQIVGYA